MATKYYNFGSGWLQDDQNKIIYSAQTNKAAKDQFNEVTLWVKNEKGEEQQVETFAVFPNHNKSNDRHPDVRFTFSIKDD